ncbi:DNA mismatch repair protein Msh4 [Chlamydoabsidia padenii]|nr:DNA mismatch repair protein Msh4 [Chlamydoabsidia padenii]
MMAIAEGCGIGTEVGVSYIHLPSSECTLSQISDLPTFTKTMLKIYLANPSKILITKSPVEPSTKLIQMIEKHFPQVQIMSLPRKNFNDKDGLAYIQKLGSPEHVVSLLRALSSKYYCLAATSALFQYLEGRDGWGFFEHTLRFNYDTVEGTMMIDAITAKNLELVNNLTKSSNKQTLYGAMNYTTTPMGSRLLRTTILQPSTDIDTINFRLDAVQELLKKEAQFFSLKSSLKHLTDLDHVISAITKAPHSKTNPGQQQATTVYAAESHINHLITLKNALNTIGMISQTLKSYLHDPLLCKIDRLVSLEKLGDLRQLIIETINEDIGIEKTSLGIRNQRCYAIQSGVNGLLDVARQTYKETIEDIYDTVTEYCSTFGLKLKLQFDNERKFYLSLPVDKDIPNLPPLFINISKKKKSMSFSSLELLQKNSRVEESLSEIYLMSDRIVNQLLESFRKDIHTLYKVSEAIALLDLLLSFATSCTVTDKVRPEFTDTLAIKSGRHPILEAINTNETVPNDTFASLSSKFQLITGPNMSGKSTYIKQVALLTIMAQTGSFVPAEYASCKMVDQILSRLANDTDFSTSYFMAEMQEMAYVLHHVTNSSLVIVDELGRGASRLDAISISTAISEELIRSKAQCFFATHLIEMAKSLQLHPTVVNLQLAIDTHLMSSIISYPYLVKDGLTETDHYGILTAKYMGYSETIIATAMEVSKKLKATEHVGNSKGATNTHRHQVLYWFADKLLQLAHSPQTEESLHNQLHALQTQLANQIQHN